MSRFRRQHRLNKAEDFDKVFGNARRSRDGQFVVLACRNGRPYPRLGMAISKKTLRLVVSRNKVKRTIRESFRAHAHQLSGLDIVVLAQKQTKSSESRIMNQSLRAHWQRILRCAK